MAVRQGPVEDLDLMPTAAFWRGRRVLVTGHTGFKGAWLVQWLCMLGARVTGIALPPARREALGHPRRQFVRRIRHSPAQRNGDNSRRAFTAP